MTLLGLVKRYENEAKNLCYSLVRKKTAYNWANDACYCEHASKRAEQQGPLLKAREEGQEGEDGNEDARCTDTLKRPPEDENIH